MMSGCSRCSCPPWSDPAMRCYSELLARSIDCFETRPTYLRTLIMYTAIFGNTMKLCTGYSFRSKMKSWLRWKNHTTNSQIWHSSEVSMSTHLFPRSLTIRNRTTLLKLSASMSQMI
ncbi:hypothetical protein DVH24_042395 [Malus domestica]|uniref:Uncharacterized protein n=1 Tax=Malus domestica TaxID=3750 RepID=A0A498J1U1_MALDO|nr:hypothetical protein DVH24_042395 [Malus domestica]